LNFDGNFRLIGRADVSKIKALVNQLTPQHWVADQSRQQRYNVHKDTQSIGLVYDLDFRHMNPTRHPALQMFGPAITPILDIIANHYDNTPIGKSMTAKYGQGYCIRANLVRLNPMGEIDPHQDKNFSLAHSHRLHIPIITNANVKFTVGNETRCLQEGDIVEINNRREHSVKNESGAERVHLIFDWVIPGEPCCCAVSKHQEEMCNPTLCEETDLMREPCECYPVN
jgi:hypothetical protein